VTLCRSDDFPPHDLTRVRVISVRPEFPGSTIWIGRGATEDGRRITFAGDWRPMRDIYEALDAGDIAMVELASWQIMSSWEN